VVVAHASGGSGYFTPPATTLIKVTNKSMKKRIIDNRKKEKFMLDDDYLNGQAKLCGWQGTLVYMSLCRHANKEQESFPSIKLMAEQHNVGRNTILKGIKNLENRNLIQIGKKRTKSGQWLNNTYTLLDKSEWNYNQVLEKDTDSQVPLGTIPSPSHKHDQVLEKDTKETHSEGNKYKETHNIAEVNSAIIPDLLKDKNIHIQIIGLYALAKKIEFKSIEQQKSFIKRNLRPAKDLISYDIERVKEVLRYLYQYADFKWTLETVGKYIDEDLNKLKINNHNIAII